MRSISINLTNPDLTIYNKCIKSNNFVLTLCEYTRYDTFGHIKIVHYHEFNEYFVKNNTDIDVVVNVKINDAIYMKYINKIFHISSNKNLVIRPNEHIFFKYDI